MDYELVRIKWKDPQFLELRGLCVVEDLEVVKSMQCEIVGHLIKETREDFFIAKEVWENGCFKYIHVIPKKIVDVVDYLCSNEKKLRLKM